MKKKTYTKEFKEQAVVLAKELGSFSKAAEQLGLPASNIHTWEKRLEYKTNTQTESELEIKRLRKENLELKKVNSILKSAAAFFSQDHLK